MSRHAHITSDNVYDIDTDHYTSVSLDESDFFAVYMRADGGFSIVGPYSSLEDAEKDNLGKLNDLTGYDKNNPQGRFVRAQQGYSI